MITILFFAKYREQLGLGKMNFTLDTALSVSDLKKCLVSDGGDKWAEVLFADNTLCAVNHTIANDSVEIKDGDEVAFYPPVTGG